jgi:hypothetical protein
MAKLAHPALHLALAAVAALALAGCRTESYRYKLTLVVNTPEGVKRGSSVVEVVFWDVVIPARGTMHKLRGEALYLDLGAGARPLIALLTDQLHPRYNIDVRWFSDGGPSYFLLERLYGLRPPSPPTTTVLAYISKLASMRGPRKMTPDDLPDLVTFADVDEPKSVIEVDRNDPQGSLGPNITWHEITLEITDEPITTGIEKKLPWIGEYFQKNLRLNGSSYHDNNELANILSWYDFDQSPDLKRNK